MKKFSTLSIATILVTLGGVSSAYAIVPLASGSEKIEFRSITPGESVVAAPDRKTEAPAGVITIPSDNDPYIATAPAGEHHTLIHSGTGYGFNSFIGAWRQSSAGTIANFIIGEDNKVYLNNIISQNYSECYVEGTRDGNRLSFTFPQVIRHYLDDNDEEANSYALVCVEKPIDDRGNTWYFPASDQTYTFIMEADGTLRPEDPTLMIGMCEWEEEEEEYPAQWVWRAVGDVIEKLSPLNETLVEVPEDAKFELWNLVYGAEARAIEGAIVGDKIYLRGTYDAPGLENAVVMGTISGDKAIFETGQYMGIYEARNSLCFFMTGALVENEYNPEYKSFQASEQLEFAYDAAAKKLDGTDQAFLFSASKKEVLFFLCVNNPIICVPDYTKPQAEPMYPLNVRFWDSVSGIENAYEIDFDFPYYDVNYIQLDPRNLYYQLLIDDEVFTFDKKYYPMLLSPMTMVPFEMSDREFFANGYQHALIFYNYIPFKTLALRTVFKQGAKELYSEIVPITIPKKVDTIEAEEVAAVEIFDLSGQRVENPAPGIYMKKYVMTDGRTIVRKEVVK